MHSCKSTIPFIVREGLFFIFFLKDWNVIVNFGAMFLRNAFCNPHNIATFLLFQFQIRVKDSKMKLLHKSIDVQFDLILEEFVFQSLFARIGTGALKTLLVVLVVFGHAANLFVIICACQGFETVGVELSTGGIQFFPVILGQFGAEGIDGDDKSSSVRFKLQN